MRSNTIRPIFALCAISIAFSASAAEEVTLKIAHFLPSANSTQQRVLEPWCAEMKQSSNGRIACQFYPAMQLGGTPAQLVDQVKNGIADVVWTAPGYSAGRFPAIEAFELPFMVVDSASSSKALWKYFQQHAQAEFAPYKVLALYTDAGQAIHTSKKEVTNAASFSGLKLRSSTRVGAKMLTALGASPVAMPPAQVTEAIAKGVVDGSLGSWELVYPTKLSEVTKFHAEPAKGLAYPSATILTVLMNKEKYESLPADLKAIVDKTTGEIMGNKAAAVFDDVAVETRKKIVAQGDKITSFSASDLAEMKRKTVAVEEEWAKQVGEKGLDGKKLIAAARELTGTNK